MGKQTPCTRSTANRRRATRRAPRCVSASRLELLQIAHGGAIENLAVRIESRAVAGTVPRFFGGVPLHDAFEVRAGRRARVQFPALVAVGGDFVQAVPDET